MKHFVSEKTLKNGLDILYLDVPGSSSFDLAIAVKSGYRYASVEDIDKYELPHILEHLVFDGSSSYRTSDDLQKIYSSGGGEFNGLTTPYHNIFTFHNRVRNAEKIITTSLNMVFFPKLEKKSFDEELRVIENELHENVGDFSGNASLYTAQKILPEFLSSTDTQIARLGNNRFEDVGSFHRKYYDTANTTLMIAADFREISKTAIEKLVLQATKEAPQGVVRELPVFDLADSDGNTTPVSLHKTLEDTIVNAVFALSGRLELEDMLCLSLFSSMVTGLKSYSINYKLRKKGLVYDVDFSVIQSAETYGFELSINSSNDKFIEVYAYFMGELRMLAENGISEKQFEELRKNFIESFEDKTDSSDAIIGWYLHDYLMDKTLLTPGDYARLSEGILQEKMLDMVRRVLVYDNLYQTVFSPKAARASVSIDSLSKEILREKKQVTGDLISKTAIPIGSGDAHYIKTMYVLLGLLLITFLAPLITNWNDSLSGIFIEKLGFPWKLVAPVYFVWLLCMPFVMRGNELRKDMAQMIFVFVAWLGIVAIFDASSFMVPFLSSDFIIKTQASGMVLVAAITFLFSLYGIRKIFVKSKLD
jgi:predicted Zn-dependent peptidase